MYYVFNLCCSCSATKLLLIAAAEYYSYALATDLVPIVSLFVAVHIICYIASIDCMLSMQGYKVDKMYHLIHGGHFYIS